MYKCARKCAMNVQNKAESVPQLLFIRLTSISFHFHHHFHDFVKFTVFTIYLSTLSVIEHRLRNRSETEVC